MPAHVELADDSSMFLGRTIYRVRATCDLPHHHVSQGDLGGWVESIDNLTDEAWVAREGVIVDEAVAGERSLVTGSAHLMHRARLSGESIAHEHCLIRGDSHIHGTSIIGGLMNVCSADIGGHSHFPGNIAIDGESIHIRNVTVSPTLRVTVRTHAHLEDSRHIMSVGPLWAGDRPATLMRAADPDTGEFFAQVDVAGLLVRLDEFVPTVLDTSRVRHDSRWVPRVFEFHERLLQCSEFMGL